MPSFSKVFMAGVLATQSLWAQVLTVPATSAATPPAPPSAQSAPAGPVTSEPTKGHVPLIFDKEAYGVELEGPRLSWDLSSNPVFAGIALNEQYGMTLEKKENEIQVRLQWKKASLENPVLFLFGEGTTVLSEEKSPQAFYSFDQKLIPQPAADSTKGWEQVQVRWRAGDAAPVRRLCLFSGDWITSKTLCSPFINKNGDVETVPSGIVINGTAQKKQDDILLSKAGVLDASLILPNGLTLQVHSSAPSTDVREIVKSENEVQVIAEGTTVAGPEIRELTEKRSAFWMNTMGDLRQFYDFKIPNLQPAPLKVRTADGFLYTYELSWDRLPEEKDRVFLAPRAPHSTYADSVNLRVLIPKGATLSTSEKKVSDDKGTGYINWQYASPEFREFNRSHLTVQRPPPEKGAPEPLPDIFVDEVMRMPNSYLSARVGISINNKLATGTVGDLLATHWFNEPLGDSYFFSRHRWGVSAGYITTIYTAIPDSKMTMTNFDLLYRLQPGVQDWDETVGLSLSYSNIRYLDMRATPLAGAGIFWSRSLPQWFDYIFGVIPFFRKPKWVDISGTFYNLSMDPDIKGHLLQVRATGRIQMGPNYFFEGGWGILTTAYTDQKDFNKVNLSAGRAFLGYGLRF